MLKLPLNRKLALKLMQTAYLSLQGQTQALIGHSASWHFCRPDWALGIGQGKTTTKQAQQRQCSRADNIQALSSAFHIAKFTMAHGRIERVSHYVLSTRRCLFPLCLIRANGGLCMLPQAIPFVRAAAVLRLNLH